MNAILAVLVLLTISLQRTYQAVPLKELKKRARLGDEVAAVLHRAAAYGPSLQAILWTLVLTTSALFMVNIARSASLWVAVLVSAATLWVGFVWLPARKVNRFSLRIAHMLAPVFAWFLNYLHPLLERVMLFIRRHHPVTVHTGLYDKDDLIDLLQRQQVQADNRISEFELSIALHALTFGELLVRDCMIPRRMVKTLSADDPIGPILMTELHDSGHSRFPVYEGKPDAIVGTLLMRDLVNAKTGGTVRSHMRPDVFYLHEEQNLAEALQAILKTRHHMFIVVNSFEEYVGIISIEDVLERVVGHPIVDEFDQYDDLRAVAAKIAQKEHKEHMKKSTPEQSEVVE